MRARPRLIINADDLAYDDGITAGIMLALDHGIVTSTTAMMAVRGSEDRIRPHLPTLQGRTGVHLQLTAGRPLSNVRDGSTLVRRDGAFPRRPQALSSLDPTEVYDEWMAQVASFVALGLEPTHVDTHHGVHCHPKLTPPYLEVARAAGIGCRGGSPPLARTIRQAGVPCPDPTDAEWTIHDRTVEGLRAHLVSAAGTVPADGVAELVTHPGYTNANSVSSYTTGRQEELEALTSAAAREMVTELGFELVPYSAIL